MEHITHNIFRKIPPLIRQPAEWVMGIFGIFKKKNYGFTLMEILVSISIMLVMTTIVLVDYRSANNKTALNNAAQKLASDIRLAQEFAFGEKEFNGTVPMRWGVHFEGGSSVQDKYYIFADLPNVPNTSFPNGNYVMQHSTDTPEDLQEVYQKIKLPSATADNSDQEKISITKISDCNGMVTVAGMQMDITFESQLAKNGFNMVNISAEACNGIGLCLFNLNNICITLKDNTSNNIKVVKVNKVGLIEILNEEP